jgi:hypothetical protein
MITKNTPKQNSPQIDTILNSLLVTVMVASVAWAAIEPGLAPLVGR